ARGGSSWRSPFELAQLLAGNFGGQGQVLAVALDGLLSVAAEDVAQEFPRLRIDSLALFLLQVVVDVADQREAATLHAVQRELHIRAVRFRGERDGPRLWRHERDARIGDAVTVTRQVVHHELSSPRERAVRLLSGDIRVGPQTLIPLPGS